MTEVVQKHEKPKKIHKIGSVIAAACLVVGASFGTAAPAQAATKVLSGSSKHYLSCYRAYSDTSRHLVKAGYTSQVHNATCGKKWTWSKGYIYTWKITARTPR